jgi:y4mF family transcriptional regulator
VVRTALDVGQMVKRQRNGMNLRQLDVAGLANTGNRLIVDVENGKPTVQLQKVLDLLDILGLEVVIQPKTSRTL